MDCDVVQIQIQTLTRITITCAVLENICHPLPRQPIKLATETYPYLAGIRLADFHNDNADVKIYILFGVDCYYEFVTSIRKGAVTRVPVAIYTRVGWVVGGPVAEKEASEVSSSHFCTFHSVITHDEKLENLVEAFWNLDSIGIKDDEDESFYRTFATGLNFDKAAGIYEVGLPWKPCQLLLPDNYSNSLGRLATNTRSLKRNPAKLKQDGIIGGCPKENPDSSIGKVHYLPPIEQ